MSGDSKVHRVHFGGSWHRLRKCTKCDPNGGPQPDLEVGLSNTLKKDLPLDWTLHRIKGACNADSGDSKLSYLHVLDQPFRL